MKECTFKPKINSSLEPTPHTPAKRYNLLYNQAKTRELKLSKIRESRQKQEALALQKIQTQGPHFTHTTRSKSTTRLHNTSLEHCQKLYATHKKNQLNKKTLAQKHMKNAGVTFRPQINSGGGVKGSG